MQYPCDRFAAYIAHYLNAEDLSSVIVDAATLYDHLTVLLGTRYADPLLHHPGYASRMSPEEAGERYFEATVMRPLQLSPRVQVSVSHRLLEALCRRGLDPVWAAAAVVRERRIVGEPAPRAIPKRVQQEFSQCSERLAKLPDNISPGSPSLTIRARFGPVVLCLYMLQAKVPEEISLWNAMACVPRTLKCLPPGKAFNEFCCLMIDAIRTAHRPYGELVGLGRGLCPFDWLDVVSIQQTRALRHFLRVLSELPNLNAKAAWEQAWQQAPVAGFHDAADLWASEIGSALREPQFRTSVGKDILENLPDPESLSAEEAFLREDAFWRTVEVVTAQGVINEVEKSVLIAAYKGKHNAEIVMLAGVKEHLKSKRLTYELLLEDLEHRIHKWADAQREGEP